MSLTFKKIPNYNDYEILIDGKFKGTINLFQDVTLDDLLKLINKELKEELYQLKSGIKSKERFI